MNHKNKLHIKIISCILPILMLLDQTSFAIAKNNDQICATQTLAAVSRLGNMDLNDPQLASQFADVYDLFKDKVAIRYTTLLVADIISNTAENMLYADGIKATVSAQLTSAIDSQAPAKVNCDSIRHDGDTFCMDLPESAGLGSGKILRFFKANSELADWITEPRKLAGINDAGNHENDTYVVIQEKPSDDRSSRPVNAQSVNNLIAGMSKNPGDEGYIEIEAGITELRRMGTGIIPVILDLDTDLGYTLSGEIKKLFIEWQEETARVIYEYLESKGKRHYTKNLEARLSFITEILQFIPSSYSYEIFLELTTKGPVTIITAREFKFFAAMMENYQIPDDQKEVLFNAVKPFAIGQYEHLARRIKEGDEYNQENLPEPSKYYDLTGIANSDYVQPDNEHYLYGIDMLKHCGSKGVMLLGALCTNVENTYLGIKKDAMKISSIKTFAKNALKSKSDMVVELLIEELAAGKGKLDIVGVAEILDELIKFDKSYLLQIYGQHNLPLIVKLNSIFFEGKYPTFSEFVKSPLYPLGNVNPSWDNYDLLIDAVIDFSKKFKPKELSEKEFIFNCIYDLELPKYLILVDLWERKQISDEFVKIILSLIKGPENEEEDLYSDERWKNPFDPRELVNKVIVLSDPHLKVDLGLFLVNINRFEPRLIKDLIRAISVNPRLSESLMAFISLAVRIQEVKFSTGIWIEEAISKLLSSDISKQTYLVNSMLRPIPYFKMTGNVSNMLNAASALDDEYKARYFLRKKEYNTEGAPATIFRYIRITIHRNHEDISAKLDLSNALLDYVKTNGESQIFPNRIPPQYREEVMRDLKKSELLKWHTVIHWLCDKYNEKRHQDNLPSVSIEEIQNMPLQDLKEILLNDEIQLTLPTGEAIGIEFREDVFRMLWLNDATKACYGISASQVEDHIPDNIKKLVARGNYSEAFIELCALLLKEKDAISAKLPINDFIGHMLLKAIQYNRNKPDYDTPGNTKEELIKNLILFEFIKKAFTPIDKEEMNRMHEVYKGLVREYNHRVATGVPGYVSQKNIAQASIYQIENILTDESLELNDSNGNPLPMDTRRNVFAIFKQVNTNKEDGEVAEAYLQFCSDDVKSMAQDVILTLQTRKIFNNKRHVVTEDLGGFNFRNVEEYYEPKLDSYTLAAVYEKYLFTITARMYQKFHSKYYEKDDSGKVVPNKEKMLSLDESDLRDMVDLLESIIQVLHHAGLASTNLRTLMSEFRYSNLDLNQIRDLLDGINLATSNLYKSISVKFSNIATMIVKSITKENLSLELKLAAERAGFTDEYLATGNIKERRGKNDRLAEFISNIVVTRIIGEDPAIELLANATANIKEIINVNLTENRELKIDQRSLGETFAVRTNSTEDDSETENKSKYPLVLVGNKFKTLLDLSEDERFNIPPAFCLTTDVARRGDLFHEDGENHKEFMKIVLKEILWLERQEKKFFPFNMEKMEKLDPEFVSLINESRKTLESEGLYPEPRNKYFPKAGESPILLASVRSGSFVPLPGILDTMLNVPCTKTVKTIMLDRGYPPKFVFDTYWRYLESYSSAVLRINKQVIKDIIYDYKAQYLEDEQLSIRYLSDEQYEGLLQKIEDQIDSIITGLKYMSDEMSKGDKADVTEITKVYRTLEHKVDMHYFFNAGQVGLDTTENILPIINNVCSTDTTDISKKIYRHFTLKVSKLDHYYDADPFEVMMKSIESIFETWNSARAKKHRELTGLSDEWKTPVIVQAMKYGSLNDKSGGFVVLTDDPSTGIEAATGTILRAKPTDDIVAGAAERSGHIGKHQGKPQHENSLLLETDRPKVHSKMTEMCRVARDYLKSPATIEGVIEHDPISDEDKIWVVQVIEGALEQKGKILVPSNLQKRTLLAAKGVADCGEALLGKVVYANGIDNDFDTLRPKIVNAYNEIPEWIKDKYGDSVGIILVFDYIDPEEGLKIAYIPQVKGAICRRVGSQSHAKIIVDRAGKTLVSVTNGLSYNKGEWRLTGGPASGKISEGEFLFIDGGPASPTAGQIYRADIDPESLEKNNLIEIVKLGDLVDTTEKENEKEKSANTAMIPSISWFFRSLGISLKLQAIFEQILFLGINYGLVELMPFTGMTGIIAGTILTWCGFAVAHGRNQSLAVWGLAALNATAIIIPAAIITFPSYITLTTMAIYVQASLPYVFSSLLHLMGNLAVIENKSKNISSPAAKPGWIEKNKGDTDTDPVTPVASEPVINKYAPQYVGKYNFPELSTIGLDIDYLEYVDGSDQTRKHYIEINAALKGGFLGRQVNADGSDVNIVNVRGGINSIRDIIFLALIESDKDLSATADVLLKSHFGAFTGKSVSAFLEAAKFLLAINQILEERGQRTGNYNEVLNARIARHLADELGYKTNAEFLKDVDHAIKQVTPMLPVIIHDIFPDRVDHAQYLSMIEGNDATEEILVANVCPISDILKKIFNKHEKKDNLFESYEIYAALANNPNTPDYVLSGISRLSSETNTHIDYEKLAYQAIRNKGAGLKFLTETARKGLDRIDKKSRSLARKNIDGKMKGLAEKLANKMIPLARAKHDAQEVFISAIDTNWIPEAQRNLDGMGDLIEGFEAIMKIQGLNNVRFVIAKGGDELASKLSEAVGDARKHGLTVKNSDIMLIGSHDAIFHDKLKYLRSSDRAERNAFFGQIDPANMRDNNFVRIYDIVAASIGLAIGLGDTATYDSEYLTIRLLANYPNIRSFEFIPMAEPIDLDLLNELYKSLARFLVKA